MGIAFSLGTTPVYTFTLLMGLFASIGLGWATWESDQPRGTVFGGLAALGAALIAGRLAYVLVNWGYFQNAFPEIFQFRGLAWPGALLGGLLGLWFFSRLIHGSGQERGQGQAMALISPLFPLLPLLAIAAWMSCWTDGCADGTLSTEWYALAARDEWGNLAGRVPLHLFGILWSLLALIATDRLRAAGTSPKLAATFGLLVMTTQFWVLSTLKADPAPHWNGIRLETWWALGFTIFAAALFIIAFLRNKKNT